MDYELFIKAKEYVEIGEKDIKDDYDIICTNYNEINCIAISDSSYYLTSSLLNCLFNDYQKLYLLITDPQGSPDNFCTTYNDINKNIDNYINVISLKIPVNEITMTTETTIKENISNSRTVYVTSTGKKYHYNSTCNGGNYSATTLDKALARGLTPCKKCVD